MPPTVSDHFNPKVKSLILEAPQSYVAHFHDFYAFNLWFKFEFVGQEPVSLLAFYL